MDFRYRLDRRARLATWITAGFIAVAITLLWLLSPGSYLPAWFSSIAFAVLALAALSVPRRIRVTSAAVEIRCVIEITHITYRHLKDIRRVEPSDLKPFMPIFGSPGFFGYFGYWLARKNWDVVKVYASQRRGLVMIEDLYEQRYLVSVDEPDRLIEAVRGHMSADK